LAKSPGTRGHPVSARLCSWAPFQQQRSLELAALDRQRKRHLDTGKIQYPHDSRVSEPDTTSVNLVLALQTATPEQLRIDRPASRPVRTVQHPARATGIQQLVLIDLAHGLPHRDLLCGLDPSLSTSERRDEYRPAVSVDVAVKLW
jgi:hypothetical protein